MSQADIGQAPHVEALKNSAKIAKTLVLANCFFVLTFGNFLPIYQAVQISGPLNVLLRAENVP